MIQIIGPSQRSKFLNYYFRGLPQTLANTNEFSPSFELSKTVTVGHAHTIVADDPLAILINSFPTSGRFSGTHFEVQLQEIDLVVQLAIEQRFRIFPTWAVKHQCANIPDLLGKFVCDRPTVRTDFLFLLRQRLNIQILNPVIPSFEQIEMRRQQAVDAQTIRSKSKGHELPVPPLRFLVSPLHRHDSPRRRTDSQETREQRLKVKNDVAPRVSTLLVRNLLRSAKQHRRNDCHYQHNGDQNQKPLFIICRHHTPRKRHLAEVSHFSRESGSTLQPNSIIATMENKVGLFWKGCAA